MTSLFGAGVRHKHSVVLPTTAVYVPSGPGFPSIAGTRFQADPGALAPGGVLSGFSYFGWYKQTTRPATYLGFLTVECNYPAHYLFLCHDTRIGGLGFYDEHGGQGGPAGGHSTEPLPGLNVWYHIAFSVWFPSPGVSRVRGWIDGVPCNWDSGGAISTDGEMRGITWDGTTTIELVNQDWTETSQDGPVRALGLVGKSPLTTAEVLTLRSQSTPGTGISGLNAVGIWPLTTSSDLTNSVPGGAALTLVNGPLSADVSGPSGITVP